MESAAMKLFRKSDKENKGFIIKRDMQRMKDEITLTPEQLEIVFDTLDKKKNGYLTLDQFLKGFREYLIISSNDGMAQYADDPVVKSDYNDELAATINLIKETNVLKTSVDELEYISEHMKDGSVCQLSQWEIFLKDLNEDLQTFKNVHIKLEKLMKHKDAQHQLYVKQMFDEVELQLKEEKQKEECHEQLQKKIKEEIRVLQTELATKDELLQQLSVECRDLKKQVIRLQKKEEETNSLNSTLLSQQNYYESALETERLKREHIQSLLDNVRRRFSFEKGQCFKEGFELARRVVHTEEEGLLQQLHMLQNMQRILENETETVFQSEGL